MTESRTLGAYHVAITNIARRLRNKANPPGFDIFTAANVLGAAFAKFPSEVTADIANVPLDKAPRVEWGEEAT